MPSNFVKLQIERISQTATEGRSIGNILNLIASGGLSEEARNAKEWVKAAIVAVRQAPGGETYGDDEQSSNNTRHP
jgi:hypothetical protein